MGYTHYWRRFKEINQFSFLQIVSDFNKIKPALKPVRICKTDRYL